MMSCTVGGLASMGKKIAARAAASIPIWHARPWHLGINPQVPVSKVNNIIYSLDITSNQCVVLTCFRLTNMSMVHQKIYYEGKCSINSGKMVRFGRIRFLACALAHLHKVPAKNGSVRLEHCACSVDRVRELHQQMLRLLYNLFDGAKRAEMVDD